MHRDLKPANVLLAADGPRVIDFGISRALEGTALSRAAPPARTPDTRPTVTLSGPVSYSSSAQAYASMVISAPSSGNPSQSYSSGLLP